MIKNIYNTAFLFLAMLLNIVPAEVIAESPGLAKSTPIDAFSLMNVLNMVMGLVIVIALILGLAWVLKKYGRLPSNNLVEMKVLGGLSLGTREKAILIEVDNTRLLVGVTPGHIQTLHVLGENTVDDKAKQSQVSFNDTLNNQLEKAND